MRKVWRAAMAVAVGVSLSGAQSFNVDISVEVGSPSDSYAAMGLAGRWNAYTETDSGPIGLLGLDGGATAASLEVSGWRNAQNVGLTASSLDLARLMSDRLVSTGAPIELAFGGLQNGAYEVWTYIGSSTPRPRDVVVNDDAGTLVSMTTGWTGSLVLNQTHTFHSVTVTDGTLTVAVSGGDPFVNGIQLVRVPAPGALAALPLVCAAGLRRRR